MFILLFDPNAFNILSYNTHDTSNKPLGKKKNIYMPKVNIKSFKSKRYLLKYHIFWVMQIDVLHSKLSALFWKIHSEVLQSLEKITFKV